MHRVYQILEEEDNIQFMTMIDATTTKQPNSTNTTEGSNQNDLESNQNVTQSNDTVDESDNNSINVDQNQVLIKTETRTGYVNIDGTEREKVKNETNLSDIVKERIHRYYNKSKGNSKNTENSKVSAENTTDDDKNVEVDDIIIPRQPEEVEKAGDTKAKAFKILPKVLQEFLTSEWKSKPKCEPQHMLERIRKENRYPDHPHVDQYQLLLTPAPSFLERISLAGEFLSKKQSQLYSPFG